MAPKDEDYSEALMRCINTEIPADVRAIFNKHISMLTTRTGVNWQEYMQFGKKGNAQIKYHKDDGD